MENVEIAAICDIDESILNDRLALVEKAKGKKPAGYTDLSGIDCPTPGVCTAVGYGPRAILGTADGGSTWTPQGPATAVLRGVSCASPSTCVAVGQTEIGRGAIFRTTNGGHTWQRQPVG